MTSEHVQTNLAICFARVFHRFDRNSRSSDINFKICREIIRSVRVKILLSSNFLFSSIRNIDIDAKEYEFEIRNYSIYLVGWNKVSIHRISNAIETIVT